MLTKNFIEISNIEEINSRVLQLQFNVEWTMDDTTAITEYFLQLTSAKILEVVQGADLHCLRIKHGGYEFLLNFEEYSHACWLECITDQDIAGLQDIKQLIASIFKNRT
mgnify:CR=1 FL=1|tara:strand:+ start:79 stop:405 length:327 start_codon:yes stop_codon:yes gene_type:complete